MGEKPTGEQSTGEAQGYVCEACGETFDTEDELHKHLYAVGMVD